MTQVHPPPFFPAIQLVLCALTMSACQDLKTPPMPSELGYAHYAAPSLLGGGLGRVMTAQKGLAGDDRTVRICVESGATSYPLANALLETKLAWASWIDGSGLDVAQVWPNLEFETGETCADASPLDAATRFLGPSSPAASLSAVSSGSLSYEPLEISCVSEETQRRCTGSSMITGLGRPGSYVAWSRGEQWTKVDYSTATSASLSPWVDWVTLSEELAAQSDRQTFEPLKTAYDQLLTDSGVNPAKLVEFSRSLRDAKGAGIADTRFSEAAQAFYRSGETELRTEVRPRKSAWHTLLHEIGHTFGIDHAHDPGRDSITGPSESTRQNENGQWVTDEASMSYGAEFLYLTPDDVAGAKSARSSIEAMMKEKFGI
jgi:hypothetical protein